MAPTPKGEMTLSELKRLIKAYNVKMSVDTKGLTRPQLITKITSLGYKIDHVNKKLVGTRGKNDKSRRPQNVDMPAKPIKLTDTDKEEKQRLKVKKAREKRKELIDKGRDIEKKLQKKAPKGFHYMPDGKLMADSNHTGPPRVPASSFPVIERPKTDKEYLKLYGKLSVNMMNEILNKLPNTNSKGGGSKLKKILKIVKFKGEKELRKEVLKLGGSV